MLLAKKLNIQIDTGNSSISEMKMLSNKIEETSHKNIIIHHCPSSAFCWFIKQNNINLNIVKTLDQMFPYPMNLFSDHSPGIDMDIVAISLGAKLIEKTITENRKTKNVSHVF